MTEQSGSDFELSVEEARKQLMARIEEITDYPHSEIFAWEIDCVVAAVRAETLAEHEREMAIEAANYQDAGREMFAAVARAEAAEARAALLHRSLETAASYHGVLSPKHVASLPMHETSFEECPWLVCQSARAALAAEGEGDA